MSSWVTPVEGRIAGDLVRSLAAPKLWRRVLRRPPVVFELELDAERQWAAHFAYHTLPQYLPVTEAGLREITALDSPGLDSGESVLTLPRWAERHNGIAAHRQRIFALITCKKGTAVDILGFGAEASPLQVPDGVVVERQAGGSDLKFRAVTVYLDIPRSRVVVPDSSDERRFSDSHFRLKEGASVHLDIWARPERYGEAAERAYEWEFIVRYKEVGSKKQKELRLPGGGKKFKLVNGAVFPEFVDAPFSEGWGWSPRRWGPSPEF
ncbi:hypothetical protein Srot_2383 [Segniliparus rotundus DSM 44985]|uniref:Uncharacterized protein n=1 Tax=Segniliparus rotundus (strain ATCC BAA-972 / CDC 1076 / CIP 108378 / DSM 44985 / JCM 13578) TaxID=640132 RepID=D6ZAU1_SEGRD|nr:hypothetical protein [Segniliparus rotundus]ADG98827.1 hypothetical protein Srot_2383 [Segniliparus rotundus DSM 44985]